MPDRLTAGLDFTTSTGLVQIHHHVDVAQNNCLRLILSEGIDGFHEWYWGDGWVQSRLEGGFYVPFKFGADCEFVEFAGVFKGSEG